MKVFEPGTRVMVGHDRSIEAEISATKLLLYGVIYEVTLWKEADCSVIWLAESEFTTKEKKKDFGFDNGRH